MVKSQVTHSFGFVEMCHLNVALVMVGEIEEVEGGADPEVQTRHPHKGSVLKALGEVRVAGVPRDVPLLWTQTEQGQQDAPETDGPGWSSNLAAMGFIKQTSPLQTRRPSQAEPAHWKDL